MSTSLISRIATFLLVFIPLLIFPLFFVSGPDYLTSRSFGIGWNLGHIVFFAVLAGAIVRFVPRLDTLPVWGQLGVVLIITMILGVGIEVGQKLYTTRQVSMLDLLRNGLGALAGMTLLSSWPSRLSTTLRIGLRGCVLGLVLWQVYPFVLTLWDEHRARVEFPLLADFESAREISRWRHGERARTVAASGEHSLRVVLQPVAYSGTQLRHLPRDWRGFQSLALEVYVVGAEPLTLHLRVNDLAHDRTAQDYFDRFNLRLLLTPGWNSIRVPLEDIRQAPATRMMALDEIARLGLFVAALSREREIFIDHVRLLARQPMDG